MDKNSRHKLQLYLNQLPVIHASKSFYGRLMVVCVATQVKTITTEVHKMCNNLLNNFFDHTLQQKFALFSFCLMIQKLRQN